MRVELRDDTGMFSISAASDDDVDDDEDADDDGDAVNTVLNTHWVRSTSAKTKGLG